MAGATYRLIELEAAEGYAVTEYVLFTVENQKPGSMGGVQHVEMVDRFAGKAASMPPDETKMREIAVLAGGIALAAVGVVAAAEMHRRRKRR